MNALTPTHFASIVVLCATSLVTLSGCALKVPQTPDVFQPSSIEVRSPEELPRAPLPASLPPETVSRRYTDTLPYELSLDEAIRIALQNSDVVRILGGVSAASSGRTIYDPAISHTSIEEAKARFDPNLELRNNFNRTENPVAGLDATDPTGVGFLGTRTDDYALQFGLSKITTQGGTFNLNFNDNYDRFQPGVFPLNPQNRRSVDLSYTHPLLQGGGRAANLAPIVIARIDSERSYFQFKDSLQELVRGVIDAYWAVVFARTDVWARKKQVEQGTESYERAEARKRVGFSAVGEVAQARLALANFRANLITAEANLIQREAALRNILGFPPTEPRRIVPITPPTNVRVQPEWEPLVELAEQRRPDLIELKLIIEADQQRALQARNQAKPRLDAVALYRWNGLEGTTPIGASASTSGGQFTDWTLGVNFSVPLGLRQTRAALRRQDLIVARDRANLQQGLHSTIHTLAINVRNLDQFYEQYEAFKETREAARINLDQQLAEFRSERIIFLNVLQAITDWGNAVSSEAQALAQYNTELANLERQTGTILETHGIRFYEERFKSVGPLGHWVGERWYPSAIVPSENEDRYPNSQQPAENFFNLDDPLIKKPAPNLEPGQGELPAPNMQRLPLVPPAPQQIGS